MSLFATKPEILADRGDMLGAHLRRARKIRGLRQIDAAVMMGVDEHTVIDWEKERKQPTVRQYPAIIAFLGYEPWPEPQTLGGILIAERRRLGMSSAEAAVEIGVDQGTYLRWEKGSTLPLTSAKQRVRAFLRKRE